METKTDPQGELRLMEQIKKIEEPEERVTKNDSEINPTNEEVNFGHDFNEVGLAQKLIDIYGQDIRFVKGLNAWIVWDGTVWQEDGTKIYIKRLVINMLNKLKEQAAEIEDKDTRKCNIKFLTSSGTAKKIYSIIDLAQAGQGIMIDTKELNRNHALLNCSNGTVNLRTGKIQKHSREDYITKKLDIAYDSNATCPEWEKFVSELMCGDEELVDFLQKAFGYALTGEVIEQCLFFFYGKGKNGKSTILNVLKNLMAGYAKQAPAGTFTKGSSKNSANFELAYLHDARVVISTEIAEGERFDENLIKSLTGGDPFTARSPYKGFFEFEPTLTLFFATNNKPKIFGQDEGIWRRPLLVKFNYSVPADKVDKNLCKKLNSEQEGILAWLVRGAINWYKNGLQPPQAVIEATQEYREDEDRLGGFMKDVCDVGEDYHVTSSDLYKAYVKWAEENGEHPMAQRTLTQRICYRGFEKDKISGNRSLIGLRIKMGMQLKQSA